MAHSVYGESAPHPSHFSKNWQHLYGFFVFVPNKLAPEGRESLKYKCDAILLWKWTVLDHAAGIDSKKPSFFGTDLPNRGEIVKSDKGESSIIH